MRVTGCSGPSERESPLLFNTSGPSFVGILCGGTVRMNRIVIAAAAAVTSALVGSGADALSLQDGAKPAEFPPASFTGDVYVDSRGCIYIRAGFGDSVTWVPRVSRQREVVCGFPPSLGGTVPQVAENPVPAAPDPLEDPAAAPAPVPTPVAAQSPQPVPPPRTPTPAPAPGPVMAGTGIVPTINLTCPADARPGQTVVAEGLRIPLRCTPGRTESYLVQKPDGTRFQIVAVSPGQLENPQPVGHDLFAASDPAPAIPDGYRPAWEDGRLNPYRGEGWGGATAGAMALVWTQTLPHRLIDIATGRDVTELFPQARYPEVPSGTPRVTGAAAFVVSSKAAPDPDPEATPAPVPASGHRFVQVGSFSVAANAQNTILLIGRLGLPAATIDRTSGGRELKVVLAGPFASADELQAALVKVRGAGFSDAFTRR
jgi:cell division septation protein DedD